MKQLILLLSAVSLLSGCATYKAKFGKGTVANISFFSDSTVTMLSTLDLQQGRDEALLTRRFFALDEPEELRVIELDQKFQTTIDNLIQYSIKIMNISEGTATEEEMVEKYAVYLSGFRDMALEQDLVDVERFDEVLAEVREQEKFLDALRMAQPLLNAAVMNSILNVNQLTREIDALVDKVELKIDQEYEDVARYRKILEDEKSDILKAFEIIYAAYRTDEPDLSALKESRIIWMPELVPDGVPTRDELKALGEHLQARLDAMHKIHQEIDPDWQDYLTTHRELKTIAKRSKSMLQETQIIMLTWVRAHQRMAAGVVDPADWFDIGESTKALLKSAPGAVL